MYLSHKKNINIFVSISREQNYAIVSVCDVDLATCRDSLVMTEDKGWLELDKAPIFTRDGRQFAMPLSADNRTQVF